MIDAQKLKIVRASLPQYVDDEVIARVLKECNGNINNAVDKLLEFDDQRSTSSQQSSVDRETDSSDDNAHTPSKKQDRRLSRATKSALRTKHNIRQQQLALKLDMYDDSLDELLKTQTPPPLSPQKRGSAVLDSDDDNDSVEPLRDGDTSSGSEYSAPAVPPVSSVTGIKLRLTMKSRESTPQVKPESSTPEPVAEHKPAASTKRISARDMKIMKKQAQKSAAKERKQASFAATSAAKKAPEAPMKSGSDAPVTSDPPTMTSGIRTLYI